MNLCGIFIYLTSITRGVLAQYPEREAMIKYLAIIRIELKFGNVGFSKTTEKNLDNEEGYFNVQKKWSTSC